MVELPHCKVVTWREIDDWSDAVARKIADDGAGLPETIVGLTRGGWVPSRMLADRLGVKHLVALRAQHWGVTATPTGKAEITEGLFVPLTGRRVLVVDDITDTGESLKLAVEHVSEGGPASVRSATLLHITRSRIVPTYYAKEVPEKEWAWFIFPWNYWEDVRTLSRKALPEGRDAPGVVRLLREVSGIEVPLDHVSSALDASHA